jgi:hypothetical protein
MNFRRSFIILASLFVVLSCLFVLGMLISPSGSTRRAEQALLFPGLKKETVARIEIADSESKVLLVRSGSWMVDIGGRRFPASLESVEALLQEVAVLTRGSLATRNGKTAESLGLGEKPEKFLTLSDASEKPLCVLRVGKNASGGEGLYVQAGTKSEVWRTGRSLSASLTTQSARWSDLRILPADVKGDSVISLAVASRTGSSWTATRERDAKNKTSWILADRPSAAAQQEKLSAAANAVAGIAGSEFITEQGAAPLPSPAASVTVSFSDNRTFTLLFGEKGADNTYPCSLEKGQYAYRVPEWRVKEILLGAEALTSGSR